jgi:hypothetical protein
MEETGADEEKAESSVGGRGFATVELRRCEGGEVGGVWPRLDEEPEKEDLRTRGEEGSVWSVGRGLIDCVRGELGPALRNEGGSGRCARGGVVICGCGEVLVDVLLKLPRLELGLDVVDVVAVVADVVAAVLVAELGGGRLKRASRPSSTNTVTRGAVASVSFGMVICEGMGWGGWGGAVSLCTKPKAGAKSRKLSC